MNIRKKVLYTVTGSNDSNEQIKIYCINLVWFTLLVTSGLSEYFIGYDIHWKK